MPVQAPVLIGDARAREVIDRTHTTTVTHTIYYRANWKRDGKHPITWWSAVFHQGKWYRTESAQIRIVADCDLGTGTQLKFGKSLPGGFEYSFGMQPAKEACGISMARDFISVKWLGEKQGQFGLTDEIEIIEAKGRYIYEVAKGGEIIAVTVIRIDNPNPVVTRAVAVEYEVPSSEIFSLDSLTRSVVPSKYAAD